MPRAGRGRVGGAGRGVLRGAGGNSDWGDCGVGSRGDVGCGGGTWMRGRGGVARGSRDRGSSEAVEVSGGSAGVMGRRVANVNGTVEHPLLPETKTYGCAKKKKKETSVVSRGTPRTLSSSRSRGRGTGVAATPVGARRRRGNWTRRGQRGRGGEGVGGCRPPATALVLRQRRRLRRGATAGQGPARRRVRDTHAVEGGWGRGWGRRLARPPPRPRSAAATPTGPPRGRASPQSAARLVGTLHSKGRRRRRSRLGCL